MGESFRRTKSVFRSFYHKALTQLHQLCQDKWAKMSANYCEKMPTTSYLKQEKLGQMWWHWRENMFCHTVYVNVCKVCGSRLSPIVFSHHLCSCNTASSPLMQASGVSARCDGRRAKSSVSPWGFSPLSPSHQQGCWEQTYSQHMCSPPTSLSLFHTVDFLPLHRPPSSLSPDISSFFSQFRRPLMFSAACDFWHVRWGNYYTKTCCLDSRICWKYSMCFLVILIWSSFLISSLLQSGNRMWAEACLLEQDKPRCDS